MLVAGVALLVRCPKGAAIDRRRGATVPCEAASIAFRVGAHSLAGLQPADQVVALTFIVLFGSGVAQSGSTCASLQRLAQRLQI